MDAVKKRVGFADLIGVAADTALVVGASGCVAGLDSAADAGGRTRVVTEAQRLRRALR